MKSYQIALGAGLLMIGAVFAAASPLAPYFGNTVVTQDQVTKAVAHLWLDPDGKYVLVYDLGVQPVVPVVNGTFRIEGRDGRYQVKSDGSICFRPNTPPDKVYGMDRNHELFAGQACVTLGNHAPGDQWVSQDSQGREVKLWLLQGR